IGIVRIIAAPFTQTRCRHRAAGLPRHFVAALELVLELGIGGRPMLAVVGASKNSASRLPRTPQNEAPVDKNWANANGRSDTSTEQAVPKLALLGVVRLSKLG